MAYLKKCAKHRPSALREVFFYEERKMKIDAVQEIKSRVSMQEALEHYGFSASRRIPCPLHGGKDANFEVKGNTWRCYSHCGGGDVISFVQKYYNLSFQETLKKIDNDFCLNIYSERSFEELRRAHYQQRALQAKREREKREKEEAEQRYWKEFDEYRRLENNLRLYAPNSPEEEPHSLYVESLQKIEFQKYLLECANIGRQK